MYKSLLNEFGDVTQRVENAIQALTNGQGVLLVDDEDRENEGDLLFSTDHITPAQIAMMIRECSGIICLCLLPEATAKLNLAQMVTHNTSQNKTAYTISIEAKEGVTTGVSAQDRTQTIKTACAPNATAQDLNRPGHVFPLEANPDGVLARRGHTEGTIDLMRLAGLSPSGVICELTNKDGSMARLPRICQFAHEHGFPVLSIEDLIIYIQAAA